MPLKIPQTVLVTALRDGTHAGTRYVKGECVAFPAIDAAILARRHEVSLTKTVTRPIQRRGKRQAGR